MSVMQQLKDLATRASAGQTAQTNRTGQTGTSRQTSAATVQRMLMRRIQRRGPRS